MKIYSLLDITSTSTAEREGEVGVGFNLNLWNQNKMKNLFFLFYWKKSTLKQSARYPPAVKAVVDECDFITSGFRRSIH